MSMLLMVAAMKAKLGNPIRKLVLIKLADNANDDGICWPSYRHIADQCEVDRKTAIRHVEWLEENKFLSKQYRKDDERGNKSNVYRIDIAGGIAHLVAQNTQPGGIESPPPSGTESPRTSHSFEPINEPVISGTSADAPCSECSGGFAAVMQLEGQIITGRLLSDGFHVCSKCHPEMSGDTVPCTGQPTPEQAAPSKNEKPKSGAARAEYPEEFEWIWKNKPERSGSNGKKSAYNACNARIKQGATWRELAEGIKRYAAYCKAEGKLNTPYVMQMVKFFGPDEHFRNEWAVSRPNMSYAGQNQSAQNPPRQDAPKTFKQASEVDSESLSNGKNAISNLKGLI